MLLTICNWLLYGLAEFLDLATDYCFQTFSLDMSQFSEYFPILKTSYAVFRGLGYGLIFVFAGLALVKFFQPSIFGGRESADTPAGILFKAMIAAGLVYGGNYILEYIIYIAKVPYEAFQNLGINNTNTQGSFFETLGAAIQKNGLSLKDAGSAILAIFVIAILGFNFLKLLIEIAERYVLVGLLLYTSPPFFAMATTSDTVQSFKSWIKMFISSCVMMFVSVFSCKLVLSCIASAGLAGTEAGDIRGTMVTLLVGVAMCKVAQNLDSYLKQIGLGTAETGRSLLEDMIATGRALSGIKRGAEGAGRAVLGAASKLGVSGAAYYAGKGASGEYIRQNKSGEGRNWEKIRAAAARSSAEHNAVGNMAQTGANIVKRASEDIKAAANGEPTNVKKNVVDSVKDVGKSSAFAATAAATTAASIISPAYARNQAEKQASAQATAERELSQTAHANQQAVQSDSRQYTYHPKSGESITPAQKQMLDMAEENPDKISAAQSGQFYNDYGVQAGYTLDENGDRALSPWATTAGVRYDEESDTVYSSKDGVTAEFIGKTWGENAADSFDTASQGYKNAAAFYGTVAAGDRKDEAIQSIEKTNANTLANGPKQLSEQLAFNPGFELSGSQEAGSAMLNKISDTNGRNYQNVVTKNMPEENVGGHVFKGGHYAQGEYVAEDGQKHQYTAVNEAGYLQFVATNPEEASKYRRVNSATGATYYEKDETYAEPVSGGAAQNVSTAASFQSTEPSQNVSSANAPVPDPKAEERGPENIEKLNQIRGTSGGNYDNVAVTGLDGGGQHIQGEYTAEDGSKQQFSILDEHGYKQMAAANPEEASKYRRVNSAAGATYYEKDETYAEPVSGGAAQNVSAAATFQSAEPSQTFSSSSTPVPDPKAEERGPENIEKLNRIRGTSGGNYDNVAVTSIEGGGQHIQGEYTAEDGSKQQFSILDEHGYKQMAAADPEEAAKYEARSTNPSGPVYYQKEEPVSSPASPSSSYPDMPQLHSEKAMSSDPVRNLMNEANLVERKYSDLSTAINDYRNALSHTNLLDGITPMDIKEYSGNGTTGWCMTGFTQDKTKVQYYGIDATAYTQLSDAQRQYYAPIPSYGNNGGSGNTEYVARYSNGSWSKPDITAREYTRATSYGPRNESIRSDVSSAKGVKEQLGHGSAHTQFGGRTTSRSKARPINKKKK